MKKFLIIIIFLPWLLGLTANSQAHFQLLIPSQEIVDVEGTHAISFEIIFTHPMEGGPAMEMAPPLAFGVFVQGQKTDLRSALEVVKVPVYPCQEERLEVTAYQARYLFKQPGDHLFYLIPQPYFEPAEEKFIQQITKVVVNAYEAEVGWDEIIGLPVEIVPLVRPYGLFAGNLFQGKVLVNGKPARNIEVEVEYYNQDCRLKVKGPFVTQVVKTDENGIFSYTIPWAGWWGFSALTEGGFLKKNGESYPLELDAIIWIRAHPQPKGVK